jgi:hypothetical protein
MAKRSGGSDTYESCDEATLNVAGAPNAEEPNVDAARALLALFAARLLMAMAGCDEAMRGVFGESLGDGLIVKIQPRYNLYVMARERRWGRY